MYINGSSAPQLPLQSQVFQESHLLHELIR